MHFETKAIHGGAGPDATGATRTPIYQTAAFTHATAEDLEDTFKGRKFGYFYSRVANPTVADLEARLNQLEDGRGAVAVATGMAANAAAIFALAKSGDNIVASKSLFGSTTQLLNGVVKNSGIEVRFVDATDILAYKAAIDTKTRLVFLETIGNPSMEVPDMTALSAVTRAAGVPLVVDSTFTTPYLFQAKAFGVDVVIHSTTKYLCGGGTALGGVVIDTGTFHWKLDLTEKFGDMAFLATLRKLRTTMGFSQSPQNAFYSELGLETLALRMERHCANALNLSKFLKTKASSVSYPGLPDHPNHDVAARQFNDHFGGMLTFRVGSKEAAFKVINRLKIAKNQANLGDAKTLVLHPRSTIYRDFTQKEAEESGVFDDLIRVSVGLEHIEDLKADFGGALS